MVLFPRGRRVSKERRRKGGRWGGGARAHHLEDARPARGAVVAAGSEAGRVRKRSKRGGSASVSLVGERACAREREVERARWSAGGCATGGERAPNAPVGLGRRAPLAPPLAARARLGHHLPSRPSFSGVLPPDQLVPLLLRLGRTGRVRRRAGRREDDDCQSPEREAEERVEGCELVERQVGASAPAGSGAEG